MKFYTAKVLFYYFRFKTLTMKIVSKIVLKVRAEHLIYKSHADTDILLSYALHIPRTIDIGKCTRAYPCKSISARISEKNMTKYQKNTKSCFRSNDFDFLCYKKFASIGLLDMFKKTQPYVFSQNHVIMALGNKTIANKNTFTVFNHETHRYPIERPSKSASAGSNVR